MKIVLLVQLILISINIYKVYIDRKNIMVFKVESHFLFINTNFVGLLHLASLFMNITLGIISFNYIFIYIILITELLFQAVLLVLLNQIKISTTESDGILEVKNVSKKGLNYNNKNIKFFFTTNVLLFLFILFSTSQKIQNISQNFHEIASVLSFCLYILVILQLMILLISRKHSATKKPTIFFITLIILLINLTITILTYSQITVFGYYAEIQKEKIQNEYYLIIKEDRVKCTEYQYNLVKTGIGYDIEYTKNLILKVSKLKKIK